MAAFAWFAAGLAAWGLGTVASVNLIAELGAVMLLQAAAAVVLGPKASAGLLFPLAYMIFLVPFGDESCRRCRRSPPTSRSR